MTILTDTIKPEFVLPYSVKFEKLCSQILNVCAGSLFSDILISTSCPACVKNMAASGPFNKVSNAEL